MKIDEIVTQSFSNVFEKKLQKELSNYGVLKYAEPDQIILEIRRNANIKAVSERVGNDIEKYYDVVEIDGCEYIVYKNSYGHTGSGYMSHKGDCKNPIHEHNKK